MDRLYPRRWKRRTARLVAVAMSAMAMSTQFGCGGGGSRSLIPTVGKSGRVDLTQIGGTGINVFSLHAGATTVAADGSFRTVVSNDGPQLLFARDASGALRGLSLNLPETRASRGTPEVTFDAESTALASVFLTPGILANDAAAAATRVDEIRSSAPFADYKAYLAAQLPTRSLQELVKDDVRSGELLEACIRHYMSLHPAEGPSAPARLAPDAYVVPPGYESTTMVKVNFDPKGGTWSNVPVVLTNSGWRWVTLARRDVAKTGVESWKVIDRYLGMPCTTGASGISLGSLVTWSFSEGTDVADTIPYEGLDRSEYWISGPGLQDPTEAPPGAAVDAGYIYSGHAWGMTVFGYLLLPVISLVAGVGGVVKEGLKKVWPVLTAQMWQTASTSGDTVGAAASFYQLHTGQDAQLGKTLIDFLAGVLQVAAAAPDKLLAPILTALGITVSAPTAAIAIAGISAALGVANVSVAATQIGRYTKCAKVETRELAYGILMAIQPDPKEVSADNEDEATITITAKRFLPNQDPNSDAVPAGPPVPAATIHLESTLGAWLEGSGGTMYGQTNAEGKLVVHLRSGTEGRATVTARSEHHDRTKTKTATLDFTNTYHLYRTATGTQDIWADDDVLVLLNDKVVFDGVDYNAGPVGPISFKAKKHDTLNVQAINYGPGQGRAELTPVYVRKGSKSMLVHAGLVLDWQYFSYERDVFVNAILDLPF